MIRTTQPVSYDPIDNSKLAIVFAEITQTIRFDLTETYQLHIKEWIEIPYTELVEIGGEMVEQTFYQKKVIRKTTRSMNFSDVDQLTQMLDLNYNITEVGSYRRKKYTELGHLFINNLENVRNVSWVLN
jgi:hypothetical protein